MRTIDDLRQKQALPLDLKIRLSKQRIRDWINEYGEDGVYVIEEYGYPFIGKEVSERVYYAQRYLRAYFNKQNLPNTWGFVELAGIKRGSEIRRNILESREVPEEILQEFIETNDRGTYKIRQLLGESKMPDGSSSTYNSSKYKWLASSPYMISNRCCYIMKKSPVKIYEKKTRRKAITGQMACESRLRAQQWMRNGCNAFSAKRQVSNPMAFWTEQDVLRYIIENDIKICSVYGSVIEKDGKLTTTGCKRTGCMFCGYGCHLEKPGEGRFEKMKETHPAQYDYIMRPWEEGGLNYKEVIDWLNEHGDLHIRY